MGLLEYFTGRIEVAQLVLLSIWTAYPHPLIPRPSDLCRNISNARPSQSSPFSFRIFEIIIIILGKPGKWGGDDVFDCAQK
jgi:hypothetical protein